MSLMFVQGEFGGQTVTKRAERQRESHAWSMSELLTNIKTLVKDTESVQHRLLDFEARS